jgi:3-methylfumaryl-CoA hydratase
MGVNIDKLREWIGREEVRRDRVVPAPMAALAATLDRDDGDPQAGDPLPPLWTWLYFLPTHKHSEIGPDGHPKRGGFLPPVPLPRRMFAGVRMEFRHPLKVGDEISRKSRLIDVTSKEGRSGPLIFVKVSHEISNSIGVAVREENNLVFRDHPKPHETAPSPQAAPQESSWTRAIYPDEVLLFRYSALTLNGHRIHYDRRYATEVEGYPGLVVHGPLIATLLADLLRRNLPKESVAEFSFRAVRPLFDGSPFTLSGGPEPGGKTVNLWAADAGGWLAMNATAILR